MNEKEHIFIGIWVGVGILVAVVLIGVLIILFFYCKHRRANLASPRSSITRNQSGVVSTTQSPFLRSCDSYDAIQRKHKRALGSNRAHDEKTCLSGNPEEGMNKNLNENWSVNTKVDATDNTIPSNLHVFTTNTSATGQQWRKVERASKTRPEELSETWTKR